MMNENAGEIQMFRLKTLKSSTVPHRWCVIYKGTSRTEMQCLSYRDGVWRSLGRMASDVVTVNDVAKESRTKEACWVVCDGMYEWLCVQGLYSQIVSGEVSLPFATSSSNSCVLTGQFATSSPTLIDLVVGGKRLYCIDFANWGIHNIAGIDDAVGSLKSYIDMVSLLNMGAVKSTAAAQGCARFRTHDLNDQPVYCHQVPQVRAMERAAFYGGRAECAFVGKIAEDVYDMDAVSMYPSIGLEELFPTKLVDFSPVPDMARMMKHYKKGRHIIAHVDLVTPSPDYPLRTRLPDDPTRPLTIYPTGKFSTFLAHPEFSHALESGRVLRVNNWAAYDCANIFRGNSEWFFEAKEILGKSRLLHMKNSLKLCQNSMYGHIGRRGRRWIDTEKWFDAEWGIFMHNDGGSMLVRFNRTATPGTYTYKVVRGFGNDVAYKGGTGTVTTAQRRPKATRITCRARPR